MIALFLALTAALAGDPDAPRKPGLFSQLHYGVGFVTQVGAGSDATVFGDHLIAEPIAFELRSFLSRRTAFHTTLNLSRMIAPAVRLGDGRIDYDCHFAVLFPTRGEATWVVAPGAAIAYSFTGSRYQRFQGGMRLGVDLARGDWTTGVYIRPYVGWYRDAGPGDGRVTGGVTVDLSVIYMVPKMRRS